LGVWKIFKPFRAGRRWIISENICVHIIFFGRMLRNIFGNVLPDIKKLCGMNSHFPLNMARYQHPYDSEEIPRQQLLVGFTIIGGLSRP
jgi:hypothetical protein